ncbi:MAG: helix-turn-helix transcriptional regulator [Lachnospiraceae bacterium]|nr:helix-turn-helix transcriptional regulator [Lachnospiraceae bacterium]
MAELFEYSDRLTSPVEAFICTNDTITLPVKGHWHYFLELLYVRSGCISVTCNERTYELGAGKMILIPPQSIHSIFCDEGAGFNYSCLKFSAMRIQPSEGYLPNLTKLFYNISLMKEPPLVFDGRDLPDIDLDAVFDGVISEIKRRSYGYITCAYSLLSGLIIRIIRKWYEMGIDLSNTAEVTQDSLSLIDAVSYIDTHSAENISVEGLAKRCNMSYSYFAKVFHRQYGQSCTQYIEFIRLAKAENLLLFTDNDLTDIATTTGFSDCSHLIRCFKRRHGITPHQFRKKFKSI